MTLHRVVDPLEILFPSTCPKSAIMTISSNQELKGTGNPPEAQTYALRHIVDHLVQAAAFARLWLLIDDGRYGRRKLGDDPSMHSYIQDLDEVRRATIVASNDDPPTAIGLLPHLWRYSLLRCSLSSMAHRYPKEAFEALALLGASEEAIGLAESLTDPCRRVEILAQIALRLHNFDAPAAAFLLRQATEIAYAITDSDGRSWSLQVVAMILAQAGQYGQAIQITHDIDWMIHTRYWISALHVVVLVITTAGQDETAATLLNDAGRAAHKIGSLYREIALRDIATMLAEIGHVTEAVQIAHSIQQPVSQAIGLYQITQVLVRAGSTDKALEIAQIVGVWEGEEVKRIADLHTQDQGQPWRAKAFAEIAVAHARSGNLEQAMGFLRTATRAEHGSIAGADVPLWVETLSSIAVALAEAGQLEQAQRIAAGLVEWAWEQAGRAAAQDITAVELTEWDWEQARTAVVRALAEVGYIPEALRVAKSRSKGLLQVIETLVQKGHYRETEEIINSIPVGFDHDERGLTKAMKSIAIMLVGVGQTARAIRLTHFVGNSKGHLEILAAISVALAVSGRTDEARSTLDEVVRTIRTTEHDYLWDRVLRTIAVVLAERGQNTEAAQIVQSMEDVELQSDTACEVAISLIRSGQPQAATTLIKRAVDSAHRIQDPQTRAKTLANITCSLIEVDWLTEAEASALAIDNPDNAWQRNSALRAIAAAYAESGRPDDALRMLGEFSHSEEWPEVLGDVVADSDDEQLGDEGHAHNVIPNPNRYSQAPQDIENPIERANALHRLALAAATRGDFVESQALSSEALALAYAYDDPDNWGTAGSEVASAFVEAGHLPLAVRIMGSLTVDEQEEILSTVAKAVNWREYHSDLVVILQQCWQEATTRDLLLQLFLLSRSVIIAYPHVGWQFVAGMQWADAHLKGEGNLLQYLDR
jgi:tetratricopeptide (TPR) repeat protein